jgi:hypothetical protein
MNEAPPIYADSPLCRFLANLQREIDEVAVAEAARAGLWRRKSSPRWAPVSEVTSGWRSQRGSERR